MFGTHACTQNNGTGDSKQNRLVHATSPYLIEHADNPVDWYEWGEEALEKAGKENKPLIISIGYASCHWCHVMEEETFMDTAVANYMNTHFVAIKVDREERPDLDEIYLNAAQLINGQGGWPLNAFALPSGKPFYAGTYFTTNQWLELLKNIKNAYQNDFDNIKKQSENLTSEIIKIQLDAGAGESAHLQGKALINTVKDSLLGKLDPQFGGIKGAPKFPMPAQWEFLLQNTYLTQDKNALRATQLTLDNLKNGGIYDALAGGFYRYATDEKWQIPHFEKMLYDNAMLVSLYAHAYQLTGDASYKTVLTESLDWVSKELTDPNGGFYSSVNADSEGEEGKFYVWQYPELETALSPQELNTLVKVYDLKKQGNWEHGKNIIFKKNNPAVLTESESLLLQTAKQKLLGIRNKRVRPSTDDKILTAWNALMLKGFVDAYQATSDRNYLSIALKNAQFLEQKLLSKDHHLSRSYRDGKATGKGFLEDYAYLSQAFLALYQATFDRHWLDLSNALMSEIDQQFLDPTSQFYFFNSKEGKQPLVNSIVLNDQVLPSPNGIVAIVKYRLGEIMYREEYLSQATVLSKKMQTTVSENPSYYSSWAYLASFLEYGVYEVAILGPGAPQIGNEFQKSFLPNAVFAGGTDQTIPLLTDKTSKNKKPTIYVCKDKVCKLPTTEVSKALELLVF